MNKAAFRFVLPAAVCASLLAAVASAQQPAPSEPEEEYGEWLAGPAELATVPVDRIPRSLRLNGQAMILGQKVFAQHCAGCHGADLKGLPEQHTPDLTDAEWRFGGDDLASGGRTKYPSDVEWTVRYGVRSGDPNTRAAEVSMLAFDPQYRTKDDTADFGGGWFINLEEIDDVVEYVLQISGRSFDGVKAGRGKVLFHDGAKGNCYDCHDEGGAGIETFGSTNLTRPDLYLYGADRESIRESIIKGRHGSMPPFGGVLKPEELKAVSVYVFSRATQK
jgi:cytochrome c oxidase cbb3-type subunit III